MRLALVGRVILFVVGAFLYFVGLPNLSTFFFCFVLLLNYPFERQTTKQFPGKEKLHTFFIEILSKIFLISFLFQYSPIFLPIFISKVLVETLTSAFEFGFISPFQQKTIKPFPKIPLLNSIPREMWRSVEYSEYVLLITRLLFTIHSKSKHIC